MAYQDLIDGGKYYQGALSTAEPSLVIKGTNAEDDILPFGYGLARGSADNLLILPASTGFRFMGIAKATDTFEQRSGFSLTAGGEMGYPSDYEVSYIRQGVVAVPVDSDCVQGAPVYLIHTASSGQVVGHFRKDADTDKADLVPDAVFWKTLAAAGIGLIRLNLP